MSLPRTALSLAILLGSCGGTTVKNIDAAFDADGTSDAAALADATPETDAAGAPDGASEPDGNPDAAIDAAIDAPAPDAAGDPGTVEFLITCENVACGMTGRLRVEIKNVSTNMVIGTATGAEVVTLAQYENISLISTPTPPGTHRATVWLDADDDGTANTGDGWCSTNPTLVDVTSNFQSYLPLVINAVR